MLRLLLAREARDVYRCARSAWLPPKPLFAPPCAVRLASTSVSARGSRSKEPKPAANLEQWDRNCMLLSSYRDREAHCAVPFKHEEQGVKLGGWLSNQRKAHAKGALDAARRARLEALGVVWDVCEQQWDRNFTLLSSYYEREGHWRVPREHTEQGTKLGEWLSTQRKVHRKGKLSAARKERLDSLGMVWEPRAQRRLTWDESFAVLSRYYDREGHCNVPQEQGTNLGAWLTTQRTAHRKGTLDAARRDRLETLGVEWDPFESQWQRSFALLTAFREREAHCDVPVKHREGGVKLGVWLQKQRRAYWENKLAATRRARLEELGVAWDASEAWSAALWDAQLARLREFHARRGHCRIFLSQAEHGPWERVWKWLTHQRSLHNRGLLSPKRTRPLKALDAFEERQRHHYPPHRRRKHQLWDRGLSSSSSSSSAGA